tara:strand:+ start:36218 stop:36772 length:555 start_codon:yes stop_codon:yes gene_type:complete
MDGLLVDRAKGTLQSMMRDRGYRDSAQGGGVSPGDGPDLCFKARGRETVSVRWLLSESKAGVREIRQLLEDMRARSANHVLLVFVKPLTTFAANELSKSEKRIELWMVDRLQYNPTLYFLTPEHRLLNQAERKTFVEKTAVATLPKILASDAIARWYGAKRGAIFEIRRQSPDGFCYVVYRVVV